MKLLDKLETEGNCLDPDVKWKSDFDKILRLSEHSRIPIQAHHKEVLRCTLRKGFREKFDKKDEDLDFFITQLSASHDSVRAVLSLLKRTSDSQMGSFQGAEYGVGGDIEKAPVDNASSITREDKEGAINFVNLSNLVRNSELLSRIDSAISARTRLEIVYADRFVEAYSARMKFLGITRMSEIQPLIENREAFIIAFGIRYAGFSVLRFGFVPRGCAIGIVQIMLLLERHGVDGLESFLEKDRFDQNDDPIELTVAYKMVYDGAKGDCRWQAQM